jgi:uncharacterized repeat protein (TIGR03803 family)
MFRKVGQPTRDTLSLFANADGGESFSLNSEGATVMKLHRHFGKVILTATFAAVVVLGGAAQVWARGYKIIHNFQGSSDGWEPVGVPAIAKNGDLYGVTLGGGKYNLGTVFKLAAPKNRGGAWTKTILYDFPGGNGGWYPLFLLIGKDGNLYGASGETFFELSPPISRHSD